MIFHRLLPRSWQGWLVKVSGLVVIGGVAWQGFVLQKKIVTVLQPDLVMMAIRVRPVTGAESGTFIETPVRNSGNTKAKKFSILKTIILKDGRKSVYREDVSSLAAGSSFVAKSPLRLAADLSQIVRIEAVVDPQNQIVELNENNNVKQLEPMFDFKLEGVAFNSSDDGYAVSVKVHNLSAFDVNRVSVNKQVTLKDGSRYSSRETLPYLSAGRTIESSGGLSFNGDLSKVERFEAVIDPDNQWRETNKENNRLELRVVADLEAVSIQLDQPSVLIRNRGTVPVGPFTIEKLVTLRDGTTQNSTERVSSLASGASLASALPSNVKTDSSSISRIDVVVDPDNQIEEENEDNNTLALDLEKASGVPADNLNFDGGWETTQPSDDFASSTEGVVNASALRKKR